MVFVRLMAILMCAILTGSSPVMAQDVALAKQTELSAAGLSKVSQAVERMIFTKRMSGAVVMVSHRGEVVYTDAQGFQDRGEEIPMSADTIFRIYSMTKPITSVAALMLWERGQIELDAPIEAYLPELAGLQVYQGLLRREALIRPVTVRDLLRHTAGMTYGFFSRTPVDRLYRNDHPLNTTSQEEFVAKMASLPLLSQPGGAWHYSVATDVLGALVARVSGQSLGAFFEENIFAPLEMVDTGFTVPDDALSRFASSYGPGMILIDGYRDSEFRQSDRLESGGGGLVSTAQDYMNFCHMLLAEGEFNGRRLLQAATVQKMIQNDLPTDERIYVTSGFGHGVSVQMEDLGDAGHVGEYGWSGAASTHFWISPQDDLILIALSQRQPYSNRLRNVLTPLVYQSLEP